MGCCESTGAHDYPVTVIPPAGFQQGPATAPPQNYPPVWSIPNQNPIGPFQECYGWRPPSHCTGTFMWVPGVRGEAVPPNAVKVGQDKDGEPIFAGRAFHEGDLLPAKINPTHSAAYVAYGGQEHAKYEYEILCSAHIGWQTADQGAVPPEAICVGQTQCGEKLYLGRTMHDGTLTPGKIQPSHNCLYIPYGGEELSFSDYEVAVLL